jgi:signal transduction histidine kinase
MAPTVSRAAGRAPRAKVPSLRRRLVLSAEAGHPGPRPTLACVTVLARYAEALAYLPWLALDALQAYGIGLPGGAVTPLVGLLVAGIVMLRRRISDERAAFAAYAVSLLVSGLSVGLHVPSMAFTEQLALAVVTIATLREAADRRALAVSAAALAAIVLSPVLREPVGGAATLYALLSTVGWGCAVGIGLVWRQNLARRRTQLADVRTAERLELARELHDVVAHQVTGIVVAAQAAAVVARSAPDEVDRALASIERAGTDALSAMRSMVGVLRGTDAARTPGAALADIPPLISAFDPFGELVRLRADAGFERAELPAGVAATGFRVVQEALTNVRRHAPLASGVEVEIRVLAGELAVAVRNDGVTGPRGPGGFGLAGMAERVDALAGTLQAGPTGAGTWAVVARLPV